MIARAGDPLTAIMDPQRIRYTPVASLSLDLPITPNLTFRTTRKIQQRQPHRRVIPDHANTTSGFVARSGHAINHSGQVAATSTDRWSLRYINPQSIVAQHPNCPSGTLLRLSADAENMVRSGAATNPHTYRDVIVRAATTGDESYFSRIVANPICPAEVLRRVCAGGDSPERDTAAANPNTPSDVIDSLCDNRDHHARAAAAANPTLTLETLTCLGDDTSAQVRTAAAANLARAGNVRHPPPVRSDH